MHELEIEWRDIALLKREHQNLVAGKPNQYLQLVQVFLNNILSLAIKVGQ
jgi:hypothetical protein